MEYLDNFHILVGKTILECQRVEHDVKILYATMLDGNYYDNIGLVKDKALGPVLIDLEKLDNSDKNPFLSEKDYNLLKEIKNIRNWLVHKSYIDFMYDTGETWNTNLDKCYGRLLNFNRRISALGDQLENYRINLYKKLRLQH